MHAPTISQDAKDKFGVEFEAVLRKLRRNESSATDDGDAAGAADGGGGPPMPPEPLEVEEDVFFKNLMSQLRNNDPKTRKLNLAAQVNHPPSSPCCACTA